MLERFVTSTSLLLVLLNPFLMTVYLIDLVKSADTRTFAGLMARGGLISAFVFSAFAVTGDALFKDLLQVRFASFLIFGGIIFLVIGVRFVLAGPGAIEQLRGAPEQVAGSIAMPFMIGPATVSASILSGARLPRTLAVLSVITALAITVVTVLLLKRIYDAVHQRFATYVARYVDIVGRVGALVIGTIAVDMILKGIDLWRSAPLTPR